MCTQADFELEIHSASGITGVFHHTLQVSHLLEGNHMSIPPNFPTTREQL